MKISRNSWHYKHIAKFWTTDPRSLCWYFWKVVFSIVIGLIMGVLFSALGLFLLFTYLYPIIGWFYWIPGMEIGSAFLWLMTGGFAMYQYRKYLYYTGRLQRKEKVHKEPGLISQYLEAKHRKICPLIEYE